MKEILETIITVFFIILSLPLFLLVGLFATLFWPVVLFFLLIDIISDNTWRGKSYELEEFIFLCYGLAVLFLLWPMVIDFIK